MSLIWSTLDFYRRTGLLDLRCYRSRLPFREQRTANGPCFQPSPELPSVPSQQPRLRKSIKYAQGERLDVWVVQSSQQRIREFELVYACIGSSSVLALKRACRSYDNLVGGGCCFFECTFTKRVGIKMGLSPSDDILRVDADVKAYESRPSAKAWLLRSSLK